jgi:hypothetical protein
MQRLAGREVLRYVYLRTGRLPLVTAGTAVRDQAIIVTRKGQPVTADPAVKASVEDLKPQEYVLKTTTNADGKKTWWIVGGDDQGALYGAYRFAEKLGVRFYLHGDVVPDERLAAVPDIDETGKPLFALRGVNPWGSHPFGFDAWSADDYKAIFSQLAKMRMNFLGVHCYPEGLPYAEPTVWHGLPGDFHERGRVKHSYTSRYFNTLLTTAWGGYRPTKTGDYSFGGALLFERDDWAPPVMAGHCPLPATPDACNEVFNRMGEQFRDAFALARRLGVKTCIGSEAPLTIPKAVQARLKAQGKDPADPAVVREVYEGTFRRIMASHPLDYYWIWTPEDWTWKDNRPEQYRATVADIKLAQEALTNAKAPFKLATAGWVLGPAHDRAAFDADLSKDVPTSAISRTMGHTEVDPAFGRISGREKWAIPWLESDGQHGLAGIQLYAGRMRRDAADAADYGCTGLMGLHWRTDILAPNASALAQAAWDQAWKPKTEAAAVWQMAGNIAAYPNAKIRGTADEVLYRTCRYDLRTIKLGVPNGKHKLTLKFCEPHFNSAGQRVFDVQVQGRTVLANLDIFSKAGQFAALDFTFDDVTVSDGTLTVELIARKSLPCISAISVESPGFTSRTNCGGAAYKDWRADDSKRSRYLPCGDFYGDWARANFGAEAADDIARLFTDIDAKVPQVSDGGCPCGALPPDARPWSAVAPRFAIVDDLEKLRGRVRGCGNLERFDYWLNSFKYLRSIAQVRCAMGAKQPDEVKRIWAEAYGSLLATVYTPGALATVVTMENHPGWGPLVVPRASQPWTKEYQGKPRIVVPTLPSHLLPGEVLTLKVILLSSTPPAGAVLCWRKLGTGPFQEIPLVHKARGVYIARFPSEGATTDVEYYIGATFGGTRLVFPATAPALNQTVVLIP